MREGWMNSQQSTWDRFFYRIINMNTALEAISHRGRDPNIPQQREVLEKSPG